MLTTRATKRIRSLVWIILAMLMTHLKIVEKPWYGKSVKNIFSLFCSLHFFFLGTNPLIPYGLPCVRELFRFLVSLINPLDRHNTDVMIHMGLSLLTVALESGADSIRTFKSLLYLVKDEMCRNLFTVSFNIVFLLFCLDTRFSFYYFLLFSK